MILSEDQVRMLESCASGPIRVESQGWKVSAALLRKGFVSEHVVGLRVYYFITPKGRAWLSEFYRREVWESSSDDDGGSAPSEN